MAGQLWLASESSSRSPNQPTPIHRTVKPPATKALVTEAQAMQRINAEGARAQLEASKQSCGKRKNRADALEAAGLRV